MSVPVRGWFRRGAPPVAALMVSWLLAGPAATAAPPGAPSEDALAALQDRGRQIALYVKAVDRAEVLLSSQGRAAPPSDRTVVVPAGSAGWRVVFLQKLTNDAPPPGAPGKGLAIVAETTFSPDAMQVGALGVIMPSKIAPATLQSYARALDEAETAALGHPEGARPFVEAVLREKDATFTVYVVSLRPEDGSRDAAADAAERLVVGRDFMVRVASTGRQVLSVEKLHESVSSLSLETRAPGAPLVHEHDKGDLPAPTDVALVLLNPVMAPLLVLTPRFLYRIDREGAVTWLGANPNQGPPLTTSPGAAPSAPPPAGGGR